MRTLIVSTFFAFFSFTAFGQDLYDPGQVAEIKLYFSFDNWHHILDSLKRAGEDERVAADLMYKGVRYKGVGVRYKGNSSYNNPSKNEARKLPFNIKIDFEEDDLALPGGYEKLKLSNGFRDPSLVREVLAYEIARTYMPAPQANFVRLYVNDAFIGVYTNVESIEDPFLERYFENDDGIFIKCDPNWRIKQPPYCPKGDKASLLYLGMDSACYNGLYELKSDHGWAQLIELTRLLHEQTNALPAKFDVNQALWMMAFNNVLANIDSYLGGLSHNYYLYEDTEGVFHPLVWDMNLAFGGFRRLTLDKELTDDELKEMSMFVHYRNEKRPLHQRLLQNDLYRKIYVAHCKTIIEEFFVNGKYLERARAWQDIVAPYVEQDPNLLYPLVTFRANIDQSQEAGGTSIIGLSELMDARTAYFEKHPLFQQNDPVITSVRHAIAGDELNVWAEVDEAERVYLCYRLGRLGAYISVPMQESVEGGKSWSASCPNGEEVCYYIVAEGAKSASLSPRRAGLEYHQSKEKL